MKTIIALLTLLSLSALAFAGAPESKPTQSPFQTIVVIQDLEGDVVILNSDDPEVSFRTEILNEDVIGFKAEKTPYELQVFRTEEIVFISAKNRVKATSFGVVTSTEKIVNYIYIPKSAKVEIVLFKTNLEINGEFQGLMIENIGGTTRLDIKMATPVVLATTH